MRIFVSYRRQDLGGHIEASVGRLYDALTAALGADSVFVDDYAIPAGRNFADSLRSEVDRADLMLVVIGPDWSRILSARNPAEDYVEIEIRAALASGMPLIPLLFGGATMPAGDHLPAGIRDLHLRRALSIGAGRDFHRDVARLIHEATRLAPSRRIISATFEAIAESGNAGNLLLHRFRDRGRLLTWREILDLWRESPEFCDFFMTVQRTCGFGSFVWEAAPLDDASLDRVYEQAILNTPRPTGEPDRQTFAGYFDADGAPDGVVAFDNLGGDAVLVVPSPIRSDADYGGLAEFLSEAPIAQQRALWRELSHHAARRVSRDPLWISVAGGGVRWLHLRLDSVPKYYRHGPFRRGR
ncbi:MAG: toll/interleukin-1 receptor domain-containing protein [Pseudomonadota bacterium]